MLVVQLRSAQYELDPRVIRIASTIVKHGWKSVLVFWGRGKSRSVGKWGEFREVFSTPPALATPSFLVMPFLLVLFYLRCIPTLIRLRPAICIAHQLDVLPVALFQRRLQPTTKVVFDNEDIYSLMISKGTPRVIDSIIRALERQLASRADLCLFPNTVMKDYLDLSDGPEAAVIPNIPEIEFVPNRIARRKDRVSDDQTFTIVYFGLITRYRGLENLIKAIGKVTSQGTRVSCSFIGDGPLVTNLIALASVMGVTERVHFLGRVSRERIPEIVSSFDSSAILNSSQDMMNRIGNPNKLYECMVLGVPVIASNFGEIGRIVKSADCGVLVNPDDVECVANGITELSKNPALRSRFSKNGKEASKNMYSWEKTEKMLVEVLSRLGASELSQE